VEDLPAEAIVYLLGSRYCETDRLSDVAWKLFDKTAPGWGRVQAICDFVHNHIAFGYEHARPTMTAWEVFNEGKGVCRDYAHLAIAFCRCMNIPARYCTGYLGDIGMPPPYAAGDRGLYRRPLVHLRCTQQHSADRPRVDRPGTRRRRRSNYPNFRAKYACQL
jgi:transglutaminase-like putative cysteine protease